MTTRTRRAVIVGLSLLGAGVLLAAVAALLFWQAWTTPLVVAGGGPVRLRIEPGWTLSAAADTMVERGLLRDRRILLLGARLGGQERGLQAGLYDLPDTLSPRRLLALLTRGATVQLALTIPEGLNADEVAVLVGEALGLSPEGFLAAADSTAAAAVRTRAALITRTQMAVLDSLAALAAGRPRPRPRRCEGYLAPDTYLFAEGVEAKQVADVLVGTQMARLDSALTLITESGQGGEVLDLTGHELLSLASIVEAEARVADERPLIAAVYTNRLLRGWRLEADPTVAYFLDKKGRRLYYKDLRRESLYNTYRHHGLPPGPIGNPGLAALLAAARPDSTCRALYFVSDGQGGHVFSRTAREHEAAVERFRRARREQGGS